MAPKAKAKVAARPEPKAKAKAVSKKRAAPEPPKSAQSPLKKGRSTEALKKGRSTELLEKAKAAAASGSSGGRPRSRVVDSEAPGRGSKTVYEDYAIKLNQTHIDANNNKFYIIQVLEENGKFFAWNRWGRVGEPGQNSLKPCGNAEAAIKEFEKKFRDKTQNPWANRDSFKPVNGKYSIVETEDTEGGGDSAPMGKLTEVQIGKGQGVLEEIEVELKKKTPKKDTMEKLSSVFYTLIPTITGRQRPPPIDNDSMLQAKVELLKFYLRMGFEEVEGEAKVAPIQGVMDIPLPASLGDCGVGGASVKSSSSQGEALAKRQAGSPPKKMGGELYAAIMLYTSNSIYQDLNKCLRDENRTKVRKYFKYLRLLFEAMAHLPKENKTLWRGISVDLFGSADYDVGKTVTWWSVTSTTADINVAKNFTKGCGGKCTLFTVESKTSTDISSMSFFGSEKESLMAPGTQLQVLSKVQNGNVAEIRLKETGRLLG